MSENTQFKLGKRIEAGEQRDAVHIAVAPVVAHERLAPGQHVGFVTGSMERVTGRPDTKIGIVDPFLGSSVVPGDRCWLFLYPNTITSLRHLWTHPLFAAPPEAATVSPEVERAMAWFRGREDEYGFETGTLILAVMANEDFCFGDNDGPEWARGSEFWRHMEIVTGREFSENHRENTYFRCAC